jgi:hypothetical protein
MVWRSSIVFLHPEGQALLNFCFQFANVDFLFRSNCLEGFSLAASYVRDACQEIPPDLGAEVQQFPYYHPADLVRCRHFPSPATG